MLLGVDYSTLPMTRESRTWNPENDGTISTRFPSDLRKRFGDFVVSSGLNASRAICLLVELGLSDGRAVNFRSLGYREGITLGAKAINQHFAEKLTEALNRSLEEIETLTK